ncbi:hypothetical protein BT93_L2846 [Corymbia citriodora subsp. variegata]|uniref:Nudix hydrolase domain-containing protein n=1 Tax=Corymbia citriodora subsp. variegata TaxID=360336 RepID=A0A8T0CJY2_CORYI|nr:hypothetical protein BT93_L2846 [Corymbia citriodora subsp. variegata]
MDEHSRQIFEAQITQHSLSRDLTTSQTGKALHIPFLPHLSLHRKPLISIRLIAVLRLKSIRLFNPLLLGRRSSVPRPVIVQGQFLSTFTPCKRKALEALRQGMTEHNDSRIEQIHLLDGFQDSYGGVTVEIKEHMDADVFATLLRASISSWKQQGKKGVWIKLPIEYSHLVDIIVKEGFRYHHAEQNYLMLVRGLPETHDTIPVNASHRVLVVQEHSGRSQGTGVWKLPTGVVNGGEHICNAVVREVKEETGVDTKFVEVLCFRQGHESFFTNSDLFFLCVLQPEPSAIDIQKVESESAQWMPIEEFADEFVGQTIDFENEPIYFTMKMCLAKALHGFPAFGPLATITGSGTRAYIYCNIPEFLEDYASFI